MQNRGLISAFWLKITMAALMLLDHMYAFLPDQPAWFTYLGRIVAPTFCYLMTESLAHTRDRGRYIRRMIGMGLFMLAVGIVFYFVFGEIIENTIFLSLGVSAGMLVQIEAARNGPRPGPHLLRAAGLFLVCTFLLEGGPLLPIWAMVFYFLRGSKLRMCAVYIAAGSLALAGYYALFYALNGWLHLLSPAVLFPQILCVFAVVPILAYNGERGPGGPAAKWFFYWFYPLHIWVLYLIARLGYSV